MNLGIEGRVAVVTGSAAGIGRATALRLASAGAAVAVSYCRSEHEAELVAKTLRDQGSDACAVFLDLGAPDSIREAVDSVLTRWGRVDILVNNAVQFVPFREARRSRFEASPAGEWNDLLRHNIEGVFATIRAVLPSMRERQWGRIVNLSSSAATDGMPGFAWYSAAKSALHGLTRTLSQELGPAGILANVVMPGPTLTESVVRGLPRAQLERYGKALPIRRLPEADDVAAVVAFLCSQANSVITGEVVRVSGGTP